ncbi:phage tail-collar fiber domain-containing protein [Acinetobacter baumannii]|uniref:phage tail-collar fiber domain-containing protein n=1 Tax=Acinetobacter baumannii TaxID=470 RepID=UPI00280EC011|nr:phage tail protein [Acinetobacter baumannii]MDQ8998153.1 phage tail protein [Acinetobacter baumannii]MDQ9001566.1 phage tail protein [Acinetobacter baumannii]
MAGELYYSVFTEQGLALLRQAIQNGTKLGITDMSFGDGGGSLPVPNSSFTHLVNEVYKTQLNSLAPDPNNSNWLRAESIISSAVGGFNIRELGLWAGNVLVAYSNYPPTYKPNPSDGTARIMTFRMVIQIDNTANFELVIDPDIVLATVSQVNNFKAEILDNTVPMVKTYDPVLGSPVRFKLNPIKASFLYGLNDPTHLDDNLNNFRGLNSQNAWDDINIPIGAVAFGRNNVPFAYLSFAFGHDCVAYGVASITGGAGSCTGNPDVPNDGANYGYCSLAIGKDTQARGRISNAMGHLCLSESRYSSTDGYKCVAGKALSTHPDYTSEGEEGAAARAHGYESKAYGNFAFAYGSFLTAYNGCQLIGKGMTSSKRGIGIGYGVDRPTIFCKEGDGRFAYVGFNTDKPMNKYDFRLEKSDTVVHVIDAQGSDSTLAAFEVKGLMGDNTYKSLHKVIITHPNSGQAYGDATYYLNNKPYLIVNQALKATFKGAVDAGGEGFSVEGKRVVGGQLPAITDLASTATLADTINKVNSILNAMRLHGLIAS